MEIKRKNNTFKCINTLFDGRKLTLNAFNSEIFPLKSTKRKGLQILTPKQMLHKYQ